MSTQTNITLTSLLPSHYVLVYAMPLLISALLLAFAGAFLTLDRTCSFAPQSSIEALPGEFGDESVKHKRKRWWGLEGGVGGLASGWVFGVHLSTFLSLIIMNRTADAPLTPAHFLVIHLLSSFLFSFLAGRFKIAALLSLGITGGISLALIVSVILHPSLLTRVIFVAILTPLVLVATMLPISRTQHCAVRLASSSAGAFATILSIALLAHIPAWADVWERLWTEVSLQNHWGTSAERGLSAAACMILAGGIVFDWFLRRKFGENPDQKWDSYLAQYAANLPNAADRAGTFQPVRSLWQRLMHPTAVNPVIFPSDAELNSKHPSILPAALRNNTSILKQARKRSAVKFQPLGGYSDSDSDMDSEPEWDTKDPARVAKFSPPEKPWLKGPVSSTNLSDPTLYGSDDEAADITKRTRADMKDYSDSDGEDITTPRSTPLSHRKSRSSQKSHRDEPGWKPDFLARHASDTHTNSSSVTAVSRTPGPPGAVPMTPSLIRAIDRIAVAQGEAYGHVSPPPLSPPPTRTTAEPDEWQSFWKSVQHKAQGT